MRLDPKALDDAHRAATEFMRDRTHFSLSPAFTGTQSTAIADAVKAMHSPALGTSIKAINAQTAASVTQQFRLPTLAQAFTIAQSTAIADAVKAMHSPALGASIKAINAQTAASVTQQFRLPTLAQAFTVAQSTAIADAVKAMHFPAMAEAMYHPPAVSALSGAIASLQTPQFSATLAGAMSQLHGTAVQSLVAEASRALHGPAVSSALADAVKLWSAPTTASVVAEAIRSQAHITSMLSRTLAVLGELDLGVEEQHLLAPLLDDSSTTTSDARLTVPLLFAVAVAVVWAATVAGPTVLETGSDALATTLFAMRLVDALVDQSPALSGFLDTFGIIGFLGLIRSVTVKRSNDTDRVDGADPGAPN